jgi:hypothetical protein
MASTITEISSLIDTAFPVPGQDNDTQGFRNNFANIKNGLERAAEEISDLDIIQIGIANQLSNFTNPTTFDGTLVTATVITSQTINNSGDITVTGDGRFIGDGSQLSNLNVSNVRQIGTLTNLTVTGNVSVGTINGFTATVYIPNAPAASTGTVGDKQGMIHANSTTVFICYRDYVSTTTDIWAKLTTDSPTW